jgi:hypothetical protein
MSIEEYNEELTKIKRFHSYLTEILDTGYMNDIEDMKKLTKLLDNISLESTTADFIDDNYDNNYDMDSEYDCMPFISNNKYKFSSESSSDVSSSDTEDEEDDKIKFNDKEQQKVNRFIASSNNDDIFQRCNNISVYKAKGFDYINIMKKFIKQSFIY